ncbi:MAG: Arabinose efflux permease [Erysipelotrichaceae bacterium]|nr:MAG: Arabinose efflux [Erysipelotrichaceae bacterium]TXT16308.1 MAG: Arabinose efflux permease [Erysipelotrichaceae bacterium]
MEKRKWTPALLFIVLMGLVSLLSDMTHEGARSIYGVFLSMTGASAAAIGFVSGFGELLGNALILVTGYIADKTHKYWMMTIIGYSINLLAIPALALVPENGWILACALIFIERIGRAIRKPSKSTMVSFASKQLGEGKTFAILEFMDQIGAFLGPVMLFFVLMAKGEGNQLSAYHLAFLVLGIPAVLTLVVLLIARRKFPDPSKFEKESTIKEPLKIKVSFILYLAAISLFAFGFIDFPMITMHISRQGLVSITILPLLYAGAMIVDAFAALFFGWFYDKYGLRVLMLSTLISATFSLFIFYVGSLEAMVIGIIMWGIGMGAQETILKAAVATLVPKKSRSIGFGVFELTFGFSWFLGSWLLGYLYDVDINLMIMISIGVQLLAIPVFYGTYRSSKQALKTD